jgi:hypothetical protein
MPSSKGTANLAIFLEPRHWISAPNARFDYFVCSVIMEFRPSMLTVMEKITGYATSLHCQFGSGVQPLQERVYRLPEIRNIQLCQN